MKRAFPKWAGPLVSVFAVYALFGALTPDTFLRSQNLLTMARQSVVVSLAAIAMTFVIVTGGIDLSAGSAVAFGTVVVAKLLRAGAPAPVAAIAAVGAGTLAGLASGLLVGRAKLMPFVVTLGAMTALRGAAKGLADEQKIDADPRGLDALLTARIEAPGIWITIAVAIVAYGLLVHTRFGRHVVAVGSNEAAAKLVGIDTGRVKAAVYALAGALFGLAGVMEFSTLTVGDPTDSVGLELRAIAAVVIGGASLSGGEGSVAGSVFGALLMTVIEAGAVHLGLPSWVQEIATGLIIVVAVAADRLRHLRATRRASA